LCLLFLGQAVYETFSLAKEQQTQGTTNRTNGGHCGKLCFILYHNDSLKVSLFVDSLEHDHPEVNTAGLDPKMKAEVRRLFDIS
jgi:hypothetical protein